VLAVGVAAEFYRFIESPAHRLSRRVRKSIEAE
jgi:peptidoglycan/LPS O-acetylase OafA/YrhL